MSRIEAIFTYMRGCPQLESLWSIAAEAAAGVSVILPQGSSDVVKYNEKIDAAGFYSCEITPQITIYTDYQINCYQAYDTGDSSPPDMNFNCLTFDEVQAICDWVSEQDDNQKFPDIEGEQVVSVECHPFVPQVRYVDESTGLICYYITLRVRTFNRKKGRYAENG